MSLMESCSRSTELKYLPRQLLQCGIAGKDSLHEAGGGEDG